MNLGKGASCFLIEKDKNVVSIDASGKSLHEYTKLSDSEVNTIVHGAKGILMKDDFLYIYVPIKSVS